MKKIEDSHAAPGSRAQSRRKHLQAISSLGLGGILLSVVGVPATLFIGFPLRPSGLSGKRQLLQLGLESRFETDRPVKVDLLSERIDAWNRLPASNIGSVWVVRRPQRLVVYSTVCPHLGCAVDFDPASAQFKCPCHASAFSLDGVVLAGPAPRPMDELTTQTEGDEVLVDYQRFKPGIRDKRII